MSKIAAFTVARLAQGAYQAYCKMAAQIDEEGLAGHVPPWDTLDPGTRQCWMAVATQLWAEMTAMQIGVVTADCKETTQ